MIAVEETAQPVTKEFLVYRVNASDSHAEIAGESSLEIEARRFAGIMAGAEPEEGVFYEVRDTDADVLMFSTR